jgi:hypothetical protein
MDTKSPRIRTILYDDEHLSQGELDLLHTPALQRLYDLHQLGLTDRIYIARHPTKCAADAMLGTALQFMGWRPLREHELDGVSAYELPAEFRNAGDAVFLHDSSKAQG